MMLYQRRHRRTPRMITGFARSVHERQSAADYDYNHDKGSQYWAVHLNLPAVETSRHQDAGK
jgi:hypothetical protein